MPTASTGASSVVFERAAGGNPQYGRQKLCPSSGRRHAADRSTLMPDIRLHNIPTPKDTRGHKRQELKPYISTFPIGNSTPGSAK